MMTTPSLEADRVTVRLYKGLLGDCLLLILETDRDGPPEKSHILIDCGVLQGTLGARKLMNDVVANVLAECGPKGLDLIVVTHEHHDHISGFGFAESQLEKAKISNLWTAWTEDPQDSDAILLQERFGKSFAILGNLATQLKVPDRTADGDQKDRLGLAGFSGPLAEEAKAHGGKERGSRKIYRNLFRWARQHEFLSPGKVLDTPGAVGLPTYVLGPPRSLDLLTKALPTAATPETYLAAAPGSIPSYDLNLPFPRQPLLKWQNVKNLDPTQELGPSICQRRYYAPSGLDADFDPQAGQAHRGIDDTARSVFATLALKMDNNTNNTSLVLAFDLPGTAGTMLFAADAQVGNWLSWDAVEFRKKPEDEPLPVKAADLLARTCLYKVGHHGSHNATLKELGLERMRAKDFVAMVPTDAEFAKEQSSGWLMPNPRVEAALLRKGLVLRGDRTLKQSIEARSNGLAADERKRRINEPVAAVDAAATEIAADETKRLEEWATGRINEAADGLFIDFKVYDRKLDQPSAR